MKNFLKKTLKIIDLFLRSERAQVVWVAIIVFILTGAWTEDWHKAIFIGVFIICFYEIYWAVNKKINEGDGKPEHVFFTYSIALLAATSLITSLLYYFVLNINPCDKKSAVYSERQCRLKEAKDVIDRDYNFDGDDDSGWFYK